MPRHSDQLATDFPTRTARVIDALEELHGRLSPDRPDEITARRMRTHCESIRQAATQNGFLDVAEIALSGETVFRAMEERRCALSAGDLDFLSNVLRSLRELNAAIIRSGHPAFSLEIIGDGFDQLLARLEAA